MPRVRSVAAPPPAGPPQAFSTQLAAAQHGFGALSTACGAAEAAADGFGDGRVCRAYGHDARIFDLSFHPATSDLLVSASDDCTAGVWRRQQGGGVAGTRYMQVASFRGHGDSVMRAAWSPDSQMVASGSSDGVVCLWRPTEAALSARHNLGAVGTEQLASLGGHPEEVYACLFLQHQQQAGATPGGANGGGSGGGSSGSAQRLVAASGESLFLWDLSTQRLLQQVPPPPPLEAASGGEHQVPERWRPGYLFGVAAQPDGPLLGAACSDGRLRLWGRQSGDSAITPLCTLPWNQAMGSDCCFGEGGLFCAVAKDGGVMMLDVRQGACRQHLRLHAPLLSCALLRQGGSQVLAAAGADGGIHLIDVDTGEVASLFPEDAPQRPLLCATLSSDGACLAASGEAVLLEEHDLLAGSSQPAAAMGLGHKPLPKWSPIHVWQRRTAAPL